MSSRLSIFEYPNLQIAWEQLNEHLANNDENLTNGGSRGTMVVSNNNIICVEDARIDPKFDFGRVLGYTDKKWSKLINNYVNLNYLDLIATDIQKRESKSKNPTYNLTFHFDNKYGSGKDCLISLTFARERGDKKPTLTFSTRASEITKRLQFDFLLVQRIAEYVYGKERECRAIVHINYMFINLECFLMYCSWKGLKKVMKKQPNGKYTKFQEKVFAKYKFFEETPLEKITFKVSQRAAAQVKKDENGYPVAGCKKLLAKKLKLFHSQRYRDKDIASLDASMTNK